MEIAVKDFHGNLTTMCSLEKTVWNKAKSVSKDHQLKYFSNLNYHGKVTQDDIANIWDVSK